MRQPRGIVKSTPPLSRLPLHVAYSLHEPTIRDQIVQAPSVPEISSHCVWLYFRFCLSYRDIEELVAEHGVVLTYEAVRSTSTILPDGFLHPITSRVHRPSTARAAPTVMELISAIKHD
jgi:hypothetical protein